MANLRDAHATPDVQPQRGPTVTRRCGVRLRGATVHPMPPPVEPTSRPALDAAVTNLRTRRSAWVATAPSARIRLLDELMRDAAAGAVCLVLGGGNVSSIGPLDALGKLFVENRVVILKTHPVNAYLGPLLEAGLAAPIRGGLLRIVHGRAGGGGYLSHQ